MYRMASKHTHVTLGTAQTVTSGTTVISSILAANDTASPVTVTFTDKGGSTILVMQVPANDSVQFHGQWICENGMIIGALSASIHVTVLHTPDGA